LKDSIKYLADLGGEVPFNAQVLVASERISTQQTKRNVKRFCQWLKRGDEEYPPRSSG